MNVILMCYLRKIDVEHNITHANLISCLCIIFLETVLNINNDAKKYVSTFRS